jgi:hypothetical protein
VVDLFQPRSPDHRRGQTREEHGPSVSSVITQGQENLQESAEKSPCGTVHISFHGCAAIATLDSDVRRRTSQRGSCKEVVATTRSATSSPTVPTTAQPCTRRAAVKLWATSGGHHADAGSGRGRRTIGSTTRGSAKRAASGGTPKLLGGRRLRGPGLGRCLDDLARGKGWAVLSQSNAAKERCLSLVARRPRPWWLNRTKSCVAAKAGARHSVYQGHAVGIPLAIAMRPVAVLVLLKLFNLPSPATQSPLALHLLGLPDSHAGCLGKPDGYSLVPLP